MTIARTHQFESLVLEKFLEVLAPILTSIELFLYAQECLTHWRTFYWILPCFSCGFIGLFMKTFFTAICFFVFTGVRHLVFYDVCWIIGELATAVNPPNIWTFLEHPHPHRQWSFLQHSPRTGQKIEMTLVNMALVPGNTGSVRDRNDHHRKVGQAFSTFLAIANDESNVEDSIPKSMCQNVTIKSVNYKIDREKTIIKKMEAVNTRGGYSAWKLMGVCRWPLKIGPKKIEEKFEFAAKKIDFCKNW